MQYKALICDVDGTLVPDQRGAMPRPKVVETIKKANHKIHIGIASAWPMFLVSKLFKILELSGPSIINGGSQIVDSKTEKTLWEQVMLEEDLKKIFQILTQLQVPFFVHDNGKDINITSDYVPVEDLKAIADYIAPDVEHDGVADVIEKFILTPTP